MAVPGFCKGSPSDAGIISGCLAVVLGPRPRRPVGAVSDGESEELEEQEYTDREAVLRREAGILQHLRDGDSSHPGYRHVVRLLGCDLDPCRPPLLTLELVAP